MRLTGYADGRPHLAADIDIKGAGAVWFAELTDREIDRLFRLAWFLLRDESEAQDATQEALTRAWTNRGQLRARENGPAWLDRILVNVCRARLRGRRRIEWLDPLSPASPAAPDPYANSIVTDAVLRLVVQLEPDRRIAVVLRYWADLPLEAIAERTGVPLGTVKSRLHYALGELRELAAIQEEAGA